MNKTIVLTKTLSCLCTLALLLGVSMPAPGYASTAAIQPAVSVNSATGFTIVSASDVQTLDPHMAFVTSSAEVISQEYETLLTYQREDPETLVPLLAESWAILDDDTTYTFTLRSGIMFHAGGQLEAHDAAYSFWRGLLQDFEGGPMFMFFNALFGVNSIDELPGDDLARCQAVKNAVTFDDQNSQVTFHLQSAYAPLANLLATPYSVLLDQEWMVAQGDWDASCSTWRDWYNPAVEDSVLYAQMNGTGPFVFDSWASGEIHMVRDPHYWRVEPLWPGASSGPANLEDLYFRVEPDPAVRADMLINGTADALDHSNKYDRSQLNPYVWGVYDGYEDLYPELVDPDNGILKEYDNLANMRQYALLFNYQMTAAGNPFILSGALDGSGIPPDFFSDIHVRKAFSYAVDWQPVIDTAYGAQAIRAQGPIPMGEIGYDTALQPYPFDLALAEDELQLAFGGALWTNGFMMILPIWSNQAFNNLANQLKNNLESIDPAKIHIQITQFSYEDMLAYRNAGFTPLWYAGWMEDYHHPHNWMMAYLLSDAPFGYGGIQHFPPALATLFESTINYCVAVSDPTEMIDCYQNIQGLSHTYAAAMWGIQVKYTDYLRAEVRGYYYNPALIPMPIYELSKGAVPTTFTVEPGSQASLDFDFPSGGSLNILLPAGALAEPIAIVFTPDTDVDERMPGGLFRSGKRFDLMVCQENQCDEPYFFEDFVTLTLQYTDADVQSLIEDELYLYVWDGSYWVDIVQQCSAGGMQYIRDPSQNRIGAPVCHFSRFVMNGEAHTQFLPVLRK
ncbi:MAG TPA: ABC transporter substrate-binding protein [Anaerolineaceae bacterium]|nr:ABC transporter substrate-binding protein [Anaerolineaceae bacterium]